MASKRRGIDAKSRLMKELRASQEEGENEIFLYLRPVDDADLLHWEAVLKGTTGSPYEGGLWGLSIAVPADYPIKPPTVKFTTKIVHPNIDWSTGEICSSLNNDWKPSVGLSGVLAAIQQLLMFPDPDSPLNVEIAVLVRNGDFAGWESIVRYWTEEERWEEGRIPGRR